jgi:hypothetical protein
MDHPFELWSGLLDDLCVAWQATNAQFSFRVPADSPARREDVALARLRPERNRDEGSGAGLDAIQVIDAASKYVAGLKSLVDSRTLVLAPLPLTRAVVEHVAHAAWLLEPGIAPDARMARRWMARLAAAYRYRWLANSRKAGKTQVSEARRARESIRDELLQRFPDAKTDWDLDKDPVPPWTVADQKYLGLGQQCRLLVKTLEKLGFGNVEGLYETLSFVAHPSPIALSAFVEKHETEGQVQFLYRTEPEQLIRPVRSASMLLYGSARLACRYFALDATPLSTWLNRFEKLTAQH